MKPQTKYAKSGEVSIAYQVFGTGSIDLVYIPGWISNIDWMWACPELVDFFEELGKIARVILFDKRGTGLSDRVIDFATLEERMDDIRAVMDAVHSEKAILFGHSEGGSVSALFAATYPNRTESLITFGIFAKRIYAPHYPWAPTDEKRQEVYDMIENSWGSGDMNLKDLAPSKANDPVFMEWLANYFRSGASPSAALKITKMNTQVDIIDILSSINVPTLILQRTKDIDVKIEEGRFIAKKIKGSKFVELDGEDHLFWTGDTASVLAEMKPFITQSNPKRTYEKQLLTVLVGRYSTKDELTDSIEDRISKIVSDHKGNPPHFSDNLFTVSFNGPSKAVFCAKDLIDGLSHLDISLQIGILIKECFPDIRVNEVMNGLAKSMLDVSNPNQILITQTVKHLLVGVDLNFQIHKTIYDDVSAESVMLFSLSKTTSQHSFMKDEETMARNIFMQNIHNIIMDNMSNELFGVDSLCKLIGLSERQLQRKLKRISHKSPNQLISSIRLNTAREFILTTDESIADIAYKTGFSNPSYFSKCFKKEFDVSPSDIRG